MKNKWRIGSVLKNILFFVVVASIVWIVIHQALSFYEKKKYPPLGQLVEVDGKEMHVLVKGEGDHTILLWSGLGTPAPALDFEPIINELAKDHRVVVVENFGYGWSDLTDKKRTVENIVEETINALKRSGIEGPYILMPHSVSGIYSMYFVNKYPDEVEAVIGIDATLPKATAYFDESVPAMPNLIKFVAPTGIARLVVAFSPDNVLPIADDGTYSKENIRMTKAITAWKGYNKNIIGEANEMTINIAKTDDMNFPSNLPTLFFTTQEDKETEDGKTNVMFYETQLTDTPSSKIITFEGHHYLHWTRYQEMGKYINQFIQSLDKN